MSNFKALRAAAKAARGGPLNLGMAAGFGYLGADFTASSAAKLGAKRRGDRAVARLNAASGAAWTGQSAAQIGAWAARRGGSAAARKITTKAAAKMARVSGPAMAAGIAGEAGWAAYQNPEMAATILAAAPEALATLRNPLRGAAFGALALTEGPEAALSAAANMPKAEATGRAWGQALDASLRPNWRQEHEDAMVAVAEGGGLPMNVAVQQGAAFLRERIAAAFRGGDAGGEPGGAGRAHVSAAAKRRAAASRAEALPKRRAARPGAATADQEARRVTYRTLDGRSVTTTQGKAAAYRRRRK